MTENEKQIVEQLGAVTIALVDMNFILLGKLVSLGVMTPEQGKETMRLLIDRNRDLARHNQRRSGMEAAFGQISDRMEKRLAELDQPAS